MLSPDSPVALGIWISKDFIYGTVSDMAMNQLYSKRILFEAEETEHTFSPSWPASFPT